MPNIRNSKWHNSFQ